MMNSRCTGQQQMQHQLITFEDNARGALSANSNIPFETYFSCIECLTPSSTLYRRYSSPSSVKLTRCAVCKRDVDPYVEREGLLVFLDLMLHRISSNRHFYLHRVRGAMIPPSTPATAALTRSTTFNSSIRLWPMWIQYTIVVTLLDAYLKYQANIKVAWEINSSTLTLLLISSLAEHLTLLATVLLFSSWSSSWLAKPLHGNSRQLHCRRKDLFDKLFMGTTLPAIYMKMLILFILIWENTQIIRGLGALLIVSHQCLSVLCIMEYEVGMVAFFNWVQGKGVRRSERECMQEKNERWTTADLSLCVALYLDDASSHSIQRPLRGFVLSGKGVAVVASILPVATGYVLRSCAALFMSRWGGVPVSCSGFHIAVTEIHACLT